jgi:hypothetical protein
VDLEHRWNFTDKETLSMYLETNMPHCHFSITNLTWTTRDRNRPTTVRNRWLTAWAMTWPAEINVICTGI